MNIQVAEGTWALILGASSGFGEAVSLELARNGYNIIGVHLDRKAAMSHVDGIVATIKDLGRQVEFFNGNAADEEYRTTVLDAVKSRLGEAETVKVLLHSLAFGTLKPYIADSPKAALTPTQMNMTCEVMAHSLVYWTQGLLQRDLMKRGGRIFTMTSSGGTRVMPSYGAISAAKAALESHIRQLALELAPLGIAANTIRAGVTDTPALRKIPGNDKIVDIALARNPHHRLTTPEDVAKGIVLLAADETGWCSGNVIGLDGGEDIVG